MNNIYSEIIRSSMPERAKATSVKKKSWHLTRYLSFPCACVLPDALYIYCMYWHCVETPLICIFVEKKETFYFFARGISCLRIVLQLRMYYKNERVIRITISIETSKMYMGRVTSVQLQLRKAIRITLWVSIPLSNLKPKLWKTLEQKNKR